MVAVDFFCDGQSNTELVNVSLETFGGFGFDLTEYDFLDTEIGSNLSNDSPASDVSCLNATDWNREALLGNDVFRRIMDDLNVYLTPVIILLGMAGNLMASLVFTTTHLKRQSSSVYLASLAVVDMLFLMCLSIIWLSWIHVNIFHQHGWCQCVVYLFYVCTFLSVWYVVSFTIERYIIVYFPLLKDQYCTRSRAKKTVCLLAVLALALYSFSAVTNGSVSFHTVTACMPLMRYYRINTIATYFDFVVTLFVPSVIIIIMNVRIVVKIMGYSKQRVQTEVSEVFKCNSISEVKYTPTVIVEQSDTNVLCSLSRYRAASKTVLFTPQSTNIKNVCALKPAASRRSKNHVQHIRIAHGRTKAQYRTARMLIIVSSVFVILNSPNHVFRIHAFLRSSLDDRYSTDLMALKWHELFQLLFHLNFSINFFLYNACGRQFRTGLRIMCNRAIRKMRSITDYLEMLGKCADKNTETDIPHAAVLVHSMDLQPAEPKDKFGPIGEGIQGL